MKHLNTALVVVVISISTVLLIGLRFDAKWAGGAGLAQHQSAFVGETEYQRGEVIDSGEDYTKVDFGEAEIWLDENTQIKILDGRKDQLTINVIQGRVVADGELTISIRETRTVFDGRISFVHYSWLNEIEIAPIEGITKLIRDDKIETLTNQALRTTTLEPYTGEVIEFDPESSNAAEFYQQI